MKINSIATVAILGCVSAHPRDLIFRPGWGKNRSAPIKPKANVTGTLAIATIARSIDPSLETSSELADSSESVKVVAKEEENEKISSAAGTILSGVALASSAIGVLALF